MESAVSRRAARVLLVDGAGRVLLFHGIDPGRPGSGYWFTPGGGLDPAESPAEGAARELREETGLDLDPAAVGPPVWQEVTEFPFEGRWYRQEQDFFYVRVPSWTVDISGFNAVERRSVDRHRWWSPAELAESTDEIYPVGLGSLLESLSATGVVG